MKMVKASDYLLKEPFGRTICHVGWQRDRAISKRLTDLECWLTFQGSGQMNIDGTEYIVKPGFFVLMRPGHYYDCKQDDQNPLGVNYIHFDGPRNWISEQFNKPLYLENTGFVDTIMSKIQTAWKQNKFGLSQQWLFCLLQELGQNKDLPKDKEAVSKIQECIRWISERDSLPQVNECAAFCHWCPSHFSRVFTQVIKKTPIEFLLDEKIQRAKYLLIETQHSIKQIAEQLGYNDIYFFSRQFKNRTQVSPLQFRKKPTKQT